MMNYLLNDGLSIPAIGLGTYKMPDDEGTVETIVFALQNGYNSIDCAAYYDNEMAVGRALKESGRPRSEVFVTSKVWRDQLGYDSTLRAFEKTLSDLATDYLDMYLLHWPGSDEQNISSWRALMRLRNEGMVKSIGVSNFDAEQLKRLIDSSGTIPAVNQIQYNPENTQQEIVDFCKANNILVEAWSPLARGRVFSNEVLTQIAEGHHKTVAQICLRWEIQNGVRPIPKSADRQRLLSNINIFDFTLTPAQLSAIDEIAMPSR